MKNKGLSPESVLLVSLSQSYEPDVFLQGPPMFNTTFCRFVLSSAQVYNEFLMGILYIT